MKRCLSFTATDRDDGTMFVVSRQLPMFSVVAQQGEWSLVFEVARQYCLVNLENKQ